jgi:hypothetical protein
LPWKEEEIAGASYRYVPEAYALAAQLISFGDLDRLIIG